MDVRKNVFVARKLLSVDVLGLLAGGVYAVSRQTHFLPFMLKVRRLDVSPTASGE